LGGEPETGKNRRLIGLAAAGLALVLMFAFWLLAGSSEGDAVQSVAGPAAPEGAGPLPVAATPRRRGTPENSIPKAAPGTGNAAGGFLAMSARIPLDIYAGQNRLGTTDGGQIPIAAGRHTLRVVNERFNVRGEVAIEVRAGELSSHTFSLPTAPVQFDVVSGAEIWIDDALAGTTPLAAVDLLIGTHQVVVTHPEFGERRRSIEVRFGETTQVKVEFNAPQG
jgi:hypothetical protein